MKLYTSCINQFLQDHCEINKIVTMEEAGGKASRVAQNNL